MRLPTGWVIEKETAELKIVRSADGRQQATLSVIQVSPTAGLEGFERLCRLRIEVEKRELTDGFVEPDAPFTHERGFGMFFSGGDRKVPRVFSGYLSLHSGELITIYVESVGVDPREHLECFKSWALGLER